jgi:hypothetical protein
MTNPANCAGIGLVANPDFSSGLLPFDLTGGGSLFGFHASANVNQYAFYVQDSMKAGNFLFKVGFRGEHCVLSVTVRDGQLASLLG